MATSTTNLGLIKPAGTDKIRIANINQNMDTLDEKIGPVGNTSLQSQLTTHSNSLNGIESGIAIVANGNTHAAISSGDFVYVKNHGTLAEGMYIATAAIAANGTLSTSNLSSASSGGLNALQSSTNQAITNVDNKIGTVPSGQTVEDQISSLNSKFTTVTQNTIVFTDSANHSVTMIFRVWQNVLSLLMDGSNAIILPTTWTSIGNLSDIRPQADRYIPFLCPGGGGGSVRIYPDGGVRIIGNQSTAVWLQTSGSVIFK